MRIVFGGMLVWTVIGNAAFADALYDVDRTVGDARVTGVIVTNHENYTLDTNDIIDWRLTLDNGSGGIVELFGPLSGNNSTVEIVGDAVFAVFDTQGREVNRTDLLFNFDNATPSSIEFRTLTGRVVSWTLSSSDCEFFSPCAETVQLEFAQVKDHSGNLSFAKAHKGTWQTTLQARDVDGDGIVDAYYDTEQDLTWLADMEYAVTSGYQPFIDDGLFSNVASWHTVMGWVDYLNTNAHLGATNWRLPRIPEGSHDSRGEMGHLYYWTLGNKVKCPSYCNAGPFINYVSIVWSESAYPDRPLWAYGYNFRDGEVSGSDKDTTLGFGAWPVLDGDIGGFAPQQTVQIDVDPWSPANPVLPNSNNLIAVAVLGSNTATGDAENLDALQIDPHSVRLGIGAAPNEAIPLVSDFNGDTNTDIAFGFRTQETGIFCEDTEVSLTGMTYAGVEVTGTDVIDATDCEDGGCHP